ncbi:hypothetical protein ACE6H2_005721 [Prunus campanulata]
MLYLMLTCAVLLLAACCPGLWTHPLIFTIQPLLSLSLSLSLSLCVQTDTSFFSSPNHTYRSPLLASSELILNFFLRQINTQES